MTFLRLATRTHRPHINTTEQHRFIPKYQNGTWVVWDTHNFEEAIFRRTEGDSFTLVFTYPLEKDAQLAANSMNLWHMSRISR